MGVGNPIQPGDRQEAKPRPIRRPPASTGTPIIASLLVFLSAATGQAQQTADSFLTRQRAIEEQVRQDLNRELPIDQKADFDWGGWYSYYLFLYDDGIKSSRTFRQNDLRLWSSLSLDQGTHQFYVRGKLQHLDFNSGDSYDGNDNDWVGPNLDRGFYQFDLQRALQAYQHERIPWNFKAKVGRDFVEFGTGYALSMPLDHVLLTMEVENLEVIGLMGTTIRSMANLDRSHPDAGHSDRNFWGTQISYKGLQKHRPFVYAFWNEDQLREKPPVLFREWDYDSWYIGFGSTGELIRNLRYSTEWVFEGGDTYGDGRYLQRDDIEAWAFDAELEYLSQWAMRPRLTAEYMFASGDRDRYGSPINTVGGNTRGDDNSFAGFGFRDTGLSFGPLLSNVHIWRLGAGFTPFEKIEPLAKLELGTDWFLYHKNRRTGAVSDTTADERSGYLGWEMDYYANWRVTSDLAWTARLGTFFPGDAFSDQTTRTFFLLGVTWSF